MKKLTPVRLKHKYFKAVEKEINKAFFDNVYKALFDIVRKPMEFLNAKSPTEEALKNGTLYYENGQFKGGINSKISRELKALGAVFSKTTKKWSLPMADIPANIKAGIVAQLDAINGMNNDLINVLDGINLEEIISKTTLEKTYDDVVKEMNDDILKTISIETVFTAEAAKFLAEEWAENLDLNIKKFTQENISQLRTKIKINATSGQRAENLIKIIEKDFNVSRSKAKFLAKQETSLLMSKMRQQRYKEAGTDKYQWSTTGLSNVRDDHRKLDRTIQTWTNPPVVNTKTGVRAHPGEDFGCNCVAIPIVEDN